MRAAGDAARRPRPRGGRHPGRRVRIVATIGPASSDPAMLRRLAEAGMDVARLNMSHGTHAGHAAVIETIRAFDRPIAILLDLSGPKLRTGANVEGRPVRLARGREVLLTPGRVRSTAERISVTYSDLAADLEPGARILLDDGQLELEVVAIEGRDVRCRVVAGGDLGEHKGIHLPGAAVSAPALTRKDREDLEFGLEHGVDWVALSFVRAAADLSVLRRAMHRLGGEVPVIAKLETTRALDDLGAILDAADGVMVARGDLGLDLAPEQVPLAQKRIIRLANSGGLPVITATQMLESMTDHPRPTRAEVTDVANAVLDGSDAVMLSGETAAGRFPREAVAMMARIIETTEHSELRHANRDRDRARRGAPSAPAPGAATTPATAAGEATLPGGRHPALAPTGRRRTAAGDVDAIAHAATLLAEETGAEAVAVYTLSGATALRVARERPPVPIFALTPSSAVVRRLGLVWGIEALEIPRERTTDRMLAAGETTLLEAGLVERGSRLVTVAGVTGLRGSTNVVQLARVGVPEPVPAGVPD